VPGVVNGTIAVLGVRVGLLPPRVLGAGRARGGLGCDLFACLLAELRGGVRVSLAQQHEHTGINGVLLAPSARVQAAKPRRRGRFGCGDLILNRHRNTPRYS
jgi:hypothetical protein